jgi:pSer/pThr/pTyr-binding forkhead associated (FHA) protein
MWILQSAPATDAEKTTPELTFRLSPGVIKTIGRATGADFIVDAALVSRIHCRLEAHADGVDLIDLESTNGTYVNGQRIDRICLTPGDRLRVGRVEFAVTRATSSP